MPTPDLKADFDSRRPADHVCEGVSCAVENGCERDPVRFKSHGCT